MAATFSNGTVSVNLKHEELDSSPKSTKISVKTFFPIGVILALICIISWLIFNSIGISNLEQENQSLKMKLAQSELHQNAISNNSQILVNSYYQDPDENLEKLRIDFLKSLSNHIFTKVENYGQFFTFAEPMSYFKGKQACENVNAHILEFDETETKIQALFEALKSTFAKTKFVFDFYIGLTDSDSEGSFKWSRSGLYYSKMPIAMSLWSRGEPNNLEAEHCVKVQDYQKGIEKMVKVYGWDKIQEEPRFREASTDNEAFALYDVNCDDEFYIVCEKD